LLKSRHVYSLPVILSCSATIKAGTEILHLRITWKLVVLLKRNLLVRHGRYLTTHTLVRGTEALPSMLMDALEGPTERGTRE